MKHNFTSIFCIEYGHKMCVSVNRPRIIEYTVIVYSGLQFNGVLLYRYAAVGAFGL